MAQRINLRAVSGASDEGIVRGNASIVAQPKHLAGEVVRVLRARRAWRVADADGHVHHAVSAEDDPRSAGALYRGKEIADFDERGAIPSRTSKCDDPGV